MESSPCGPCGTMGVATTTMFTQRSNHEGRRHIYLPIRFIIPFCSRTRYEQENWGLHLDSDSEVIQLVIVRIGSGTCENNGSCRRTWQRSAHAAPIMGCRCQVLMVSSVLTGGSYGHISFFGSRQRDPSTDRIGHEAGRDLCRVLVAASFARCSRPRNRRRTRSGTTVGGRSCQGGRS